MRVRSTTNSERTARQSTHWEGCWRAHLDCAVRRIEQLEAQLAAVHTPINGAGRVVSSGVRPPMVIEEPEEVQE